MRATLTDTGCEYEGETRLREGSFAIEVRNESRSFALFELVELADNATFDEIEPYFENARREYDVTGTSTTPLGALFKRTVARSRVDSAGSSVLSGGEPSGRYAVVCFDSPDVDVGQEPEIPTPPTHVYAATKLVVGSAS